MKRFVNNLFSSLWSSYRGLFLRLWSTSKVAALIVCGLVPVTLCLVLANTVTGGNKTSATPTSIPATAIARAINTAVPIGTAAPTLAIPTITPVPATATELPTATKAPPTNTAVPTNTLVPQTPTSVATNSPTPQASNTPKPVIEPTEAPKVGNTPTALPKSSSLAIVPTNTPVIVAATAAPTLPASTGGGSPVGWNGKEMVPAWLPCAQGQVKGNRGSSIYHAPGQRDYAKTYANVVCFNTEAEAVAAGFRKASN